MITNSTLIAIPPLPRKRKKITTTATTTTPIALIEEIYNFKHQNQKKVFKFIKIYGKVADSINELYKLEFIIRETPPRKDQGKSQQVLLQKP